MTAFGFAVLRLSSQDFWAMTPREIAAAMGAGGRPAPFARDRLAGLMAMFPDRRLDGDG